MLKRLSALAAALVLSACGGGGSGGGATAPVVVPAAVPVTVPPPPPPLTNFVTVTVDGGPAALSSGPNGYSQSNVAYVSVTICAPGSATNCQTIDHVQVDTGSVGLRIFQSVLSPGLLGALPSQTDTARNPVGECYQYVDGYVFGSVRQGDLTIGGETVPDLPFQVLSDTGVFGAVPSSCSSGGGDNLGDVRTFGSNGIIGIGTTVTDCGVYCQNGGQSAAIYYDCPTTGCATVIPRAANTVAPFQQLPNPVAAMSVDNNGSILALPASPSEGQVSATGTLYFGIGTQTNNGLGSATVYTATSSTDPQGAGLISAVYNGQTLPSSFIDSGSSAYFFEDATLPLCQSSGFKGFYCPATAITISAVIEGTNGASFTDNFELYNAQVRFNTHPTYAVMPGIGANPNIIFPSTAYAGSFDFGLPFFYGRSVYTAIEGRTAGSAAGPYYAF